MRATVNFLNVGVYLHVNFIFVPYLYGTSLAEESKELLVLFHLKN